jgi:protein-tyrosine phosphatase
MASVRFPDGTIVEAVGIWERRPDKPDRDYGFYLDASWRPTWSADVIEWEDYGLPVDPEAAAAAICAAFHRAKHGERVEVGCIGGLGRTGTVLACMAILADVAPGQAVEWVRDHYDPAAVETPEQEDWVLWFAEHVSKKHVGE